MRAVLVDEAGDEIAEGDAVALEVHAPGDCDFEDGDVFTTRKRDAGNLRGAGGDALGFRERDGGRGLRDFRGGQQLAQEAEPAGAVVGLAEGGLEFGAGHFEKDSLRMMSGAVSGRGTAPGVGVGGAGSSSG